MSRPAQLRWISTARCGAGVMLALLLGPLVARGETPSAAAYEKDVNFLATKIAQYRYALKSSPEGAQRLSILETGLSSLKSQLAQLQELAEDVKSKDDKSKYLMTMELDPKEREMRRAGSALLMWQNEESNENQALRQASDAYGSGQLTFSDKEHEAYLAKYAEWQALQDRRKALVERHAERNRELHDQLDAAIKAFTKVQQEFSETATQRDQAAASFQTLAGQYADARGPIVSELEAMDNEPAQTVSAPLTPFQQGVSREAAGTIAIIRQPIGPGQNTHALDQLQVMTASSEDAAGVDEHGHRVAEPAKPVAKRESGYVFDTGEGTGSANLPEVDTPSSSTEAAVPLVVAPAIPESAPAAVKSSPTLQKFAQTQTQGFARLDQLYQQRRELMQQGAQATPEAWTHIVKEISTTQAAVNMAGVGLKLAEGSQLIDLTIVPQAQKHVSDLNLPPPPPPGAKQP